MQFAVLFLKFVSLLKVMRIPTLEPLPEDQFQQLAARGEVRVGLRHRVSIRLQVQDANCAGDTHRARARVSPPTTNQPHTHAHTHDLGDIAIALIAVLTGTGQNKNICCC